MTAHLDTLRTHESYELENTRFLVVSDEHEPLGPLVRALLDQGLWVESWDFERNGLPSRLAASIEVVVVYGRAAKVVQSHELRRANPGLFLALVHQGPAAKLDQGWLEAGFDGSYSLEQPIGHIGDHLVAASRFVRRMRGVGVQQRQAGSLTLDCQTRTAALNGRRLELTAYEFSLLSTLADHLGNVLSRQELLELAKGSAEEAFDRSIDVQVSRLRAKLGDNPRRPSLLKTVRGKGYVLVPGTLET